jgi:hypothetical protein
MINVISKAVKNISYNLMPNVAFTVEESYGNRTENTQPLGIYDVQIIERSSGNYLAGKVKKNSSTPEQTIFLLTLNYMILKVNL